MAVALLKSARWHLSTGHGHKVGRILPGKEGMTRDVLRSLTFPENI